MDAPFYFVPGEQEKDFSVKRKSSTTVNGRVSYTEELDGVVSGSICDASQKEKFEWNQMNHPISHTIVVSGSCDVVAEDILVDSDNNKYHVQGTNNPSGLGFFTIIFCRMVRWDHDDDSQNSDNA